MLRNPSELHNRAEYFKHKIVSSIGGYTGGLSSQSDYYDLLTFLEEVIRKTSEPQVQSPFKTYSPNKKDPFRATSTKAPSSPSLKTVLSSSNKYNELERNARLGDESAIFDYLRALDHQGKVELEHLWVCPFYDHWYDSYTPGKELFPFCFPYKLGMKLSDVNAVLNNYGINKAEEIKGAFVVDVASLELADKVKNDLFSWGRGYLETPVDYIPELSKYLILQAESILTIDLSGTKLTEGIEGSLNKDRSTSKFWREEGKRLWRVGGRKGKLGPIKSSWPQREVKHKLIPHLPERSGNIPYVIILHMPTKKAFALNGQYQLLDENVDSETVLFAMRYHVSSSLGWLPSQDTQKASWAKNLPSGEFISYWIAS